MKSTIILLATVAGIGIGATQASAADTENLSCITEVDKNGATVRDCEPPQIYYTKIVYKVLPTAGGPESPIEPGRRGGDGPNSGQNGGGQHGGGQHGGGNNGPND